MKRLFVIGLFFLLYSTIFSQTPLESGTFSLGGSISFSSTSDDRTPENDTEFIFNPQFGYFLFYNFYAAVTVNYSTFKSEHVWEESIGVGPELRYYFGSENLKPFVGVGYAYNKTENSWFENNVYSDEIKLKGGANYFVIKCLAIEASINYSFITSEMVSDVCLDYTEKSEVFKMAIGVNYFIY